MNRSGLSADGFAWSASRVLGRASRAGGSRTARRQRLQELVSSNLADLLAYAERRVELPADAADALGDALEIIWR